MKLKAFFKLINVEILPRHEAKLNSLVAVGSIILAVSGVFGNLTEGIWPWIAFFVAALGCLSLVDRVKQRFNLLAALMVIFLVMLFLIVLQFFALGVS